MKHNAKNGLDSGLNPRTNLGNIFNKIIFKERIEGTVNNSRKFSFILKLGDPTK